MKETEKGHESIEGIKKKIKKCKALGFLMDEQGVVWFGKRLCVPNKVELKNLILQEAHNTTYSILYQDLKERF